MGDDDNKDSELSGNRNSEDSDRSSLHSLPYYTIHEGQAPAAAVPNADAGADRELGEQARRRKRRTPLSKKYFITFNQL